MIIKNVQIYPVKTKQSACLKVRRTPGDSCPDGPDEPDEG